MENNGGNNNSSANKDILYLMGGVALMFLGVGLVMTTPAARKTVSAALGAVLPDLQGRLMPDLTGLGPDIQRYMKLRSM
jgi:hypothetical protein